MSAAKDGSMKLLILVILLCGFALGQPGHAEEPKTSSPRWVIIATVIGVTVTSTRYNGTIHDFVMLNALAEVIRSSKPLSICYGA
jgi:hypothetical protein